MVEFTTLWLPILLSAVGVFILSSILHMVLPIHRGDYVGLPNEEAVLTAMRENGVQPGSYMFPHCTSFKAMEEEAFVAKQTLGPVGHMTILPNGPFPMGKTLAIWFLYSAGVSLFVAYLTGLGTAPGAEYMDVFQMAGAIAFLAYGFSAITDSIWKGVSWTVSAKFMFDGLVYGLVTAGVFAWLWPDAI